jgi:hypothetical protein
LFRGLPWPNDRRLLVSSSPPALQSQATGDCRVFSSGPTPTDCDINWLASHQVVFLLRAFPKSRCQMIPKNLLAPLRVARPSSTITTESLVYPGLPRLAPSTFRVSTLLAAYSSQYLVALFHATGTHGVPLKSKVSGCFVSKTSLEPRSKLPLQGSRPCCAVPLPTLLRTLDLHCRFSRQLPQTTFLAAAQTPLTGRGPETPPMSFGHAEEPNNRSHLSSTAQPGSPEYYPQQDRHLSPKGAPALLRSPIRSSLLAGLRSCSVPGSPLTLRALSPTTARDL